MLLHVQSTPNSSERKIFTSVKIVIFHNNVNMMKLQIQDYQEKLGTVA